MASNNGKCFTISHQSSSKGRTILYVCVCIEKGWLFLNMAFASDCLLSWWYVGHLTIFKLLNGTGWLTFFVAKLIYRIFIQQHNWSEVGKRDEIQVSWCWWFSFWIKQRCVYIWVYTIAHISMHIWLIEQIGTLINPR